MRRSMLLALALAVCAAFPSVAAATSNSVLVAGPLKVRAYRMYVLATPPARHTSASVDIFFERGKANDLQEHFYGFGHGVSVRIARDGSSASVQANLGGWGHVHVNFSPGAGVLTLPAGCDGSLVVQHKGPLSGSRGFALATHSSYFGEVRTNRLPAFITTLKPRQGCKPTTTRLPAGAVLLQASSLGSAHTLGSFTASRSARGVIGETATVIDLPTNFSDPT